MAITEDEFMEIKEAFTEEYWNRPPYSLYINGIAMSKIECAQDCGETEVELGDEECLDDLCIVVMMRREPAPDITLPESYQGVRVFYTVVGEIVLS